MKMPTRCCLAVVLIMLALTLLWNMNQASFAGEQDNSASQEDEENNGLQCGLDAAIFVLEYFGLEYNVRSVSAALPRSEEGVPLSDIKQLFAAFGLEPQLREEVTLSQLVKSLNGNRVAVVPLPRGTRRKHYYVVALDNNGQAVLADVPFSSSILQGSRMAEKLLKQTGGVVLFAQRTRQANTPMSSRVRVTPSPLELGEFLVSGDKSRSTLVATLSLSNLSPTAVIVSNVQTSCGCTKPDWQSGLLCSDESHDIQFTIFPGGWGVGKKNKPVLFSFADKSKLVVPVHGTGLMPQVAQHIQISQSEVELDLTDKQPKDIVDIHVALVIAHAMPFDKVTAATDAPWLKPRLVRAVEQVKGEEVQKSEAGELLASIDIKGIKPILEKPPSRTSAKIKLSTRSDIAPVEVEVNVFRRDFFHLAQSMVQLRGNNTVETTILPNQKNVHLKVSNVAAELPSLTARVKEEGGINKLIVQRVGEKAIPVGYYVVTFDVTASDGTKGVAKLIVEVVP